MPNDIANNMADTINQLEKELKDLREENKVLTSECDRLIKEKGELLKKIANVKRAHWIEVSPKHSQCSCCETTCLIAVFPISSHANFCPNCGAKMDESN